MTVSTLTKPQERQTISGKKWKFACSKCDQTQVHLLLDSGSKSELTREWLVSTWDARHRTVPRKDFNICRVTCEGCKAVIPAERLPDQIEFWVWQKPVGTLSFSIAHPESPPETSQGGGSFRCTNCGHRSIQVDVGFETSLDHGAHVNEVPDWIVSSFDRGGCAQCGEPLFDYMLPSDLDLHGSYCWQITPTFGYQALHLEHDFWDSFIKRVEHQAETWAQWNRVTHAKWLILQARKRRSKYAKSAGDLSGFLSTIERTRLLRLLRPWAT